MKKTKKCISIPEVLVFILLSSGVLVGSSQLLLGIVRSMHRTEELFSFAHERVAMYSVLYNILNPCVGAAGGGFREYPDVTLMSNGAVTACKYTSEKSIWRVLPTTISAWFYINAKHEFMLTIWGEDPDHTGQASRFDTLLANNVKYIRWLFWNEDTDTWHESWSMDPNGRWDSCLLSTSKSAALNLDCIKVVIKYMHTDQEEVFVVPAVHTKQMVIWFLKNTSNELIQKAVDIFERGSK